MADEPDDDLVSRDTEEEQKALADARVKLRRQEEDRSFEQLLNTYQGREFLWRLLSECKMYSFGFPDNDRLLNYDNGRRSIGGWAYENIFTVYPEAYTIMRQEAKDRDARFSALPLSGNGEV